MGLGTHFPIGFMGLIMSAYFSAIMSTADSCLMAASGNLMTDIISPFHRRLGDSIRASQFFTLLIGGMAIIIALQMEQVLDIMLYSYAFMVSGIFVPVLMLLINKKHSALAALLSMICGGATTLILVIAGVELPLGLDAIIFGIAASLLVFGITARFDNRSRTVG